ncbi:MAG: nicotinate-nucleotide adenylyltransferase [Xanthomonadales bacterium]|jgi:nicotinate-nucleotide adenylyltransferase|nr:nicotinate-nucleotide adenylyltransferase [Xanthomonadales bacterium]MDH3940024.1 nicotinate-nucleotide adenylyltransferase [Xanthomonadales bacterium]MDH4001190.1 nicotinate-nucleotide adenylyltransferase [Xanthomonadales bacterium]
MARAIGIFGGTFDPVHFGHLRAALEARELLGLQDFRLLPSGTPPHRSVTMASSQHRLAMLRQAVAAYPEFSVDDRECRREGRSFMTDTLADIRSGAGDKPLILIIGQDAANGLDRWHEWQSLFELAHIAIMRRPDSQTSWSPALQAQMKGRLVARAHELLKQPAGSVLNLQVTQLAISSTDIRQRIKDGRSARFLLPDAVIDYIEQNRLYFAGQPRKG